MKTANILNKPKFWVAVVFSVLFIGVPVLLGCDENSPAIKKQQEIQQQQLEQQRKMQEEQEREQRQKQLEQMNNIPVNFRPA
ncbi:MAG: hypothetical protein M1517_07815 [Deltaproteobacteria bacterium]|nr:hypothetical protein [Deltaproteobacteria bacterium]